VGVEAVSYIIKLNIILFCPAAGAALQQTEQQVPTSLDGKYHIESENKEVVSQQPKPFTIGLYHYWLLFMNFD